MRRTARAMTARVSGSSGHPEEGRHGLLTHLQEPSLLGQTAWARLHPTCLSGESEVGGMY